MNTRNYNLQSIKTFFPILQNQLHGYNKDYNKDYTVTKSKNNRWRQLVMIAKITGDSIRVKRLSSRARNFKVQRIVVKQLFKWGFKGRSRWRDSTFGTLRTSSCVSVHVFARMRTQLFRAIKRVCTAVWIIFNYANLTKIYRIIFDDF